MRRLSGQSFLSLITHQTSDKVLTFPAAQLVPVHPQHPPGMEHLLLLLLLVCVAESDYPPPCYSCTGGCQACGDQGVVDCQWSAWSWGPCSASCGRGRQTASRYVVRQSQQGGRQCGSLSWASRDCSGPACPVDCRWGDWSRWQCSVTCGQGRQFRTRAVGVVASGGGRDCEGDSYFVGGSCWSGCCPQDCEWSSWTWGSCSLSCGGGIRIATREQAREQCGGQPCDGEQEQTAPCNIFPCEEEPCEWGGWEGWSDFVIVESRDGTQSQTRTRLSREQGGQSCGNVRSENETLPTVRIVDTTPSAQTFSPGALALGLIGFLMLLLLGLALAWCCWRYCRKTQGKQFKKGNDNFTVVEEFEALDGKKESRDEVDQNKVSAQDNEVRALNFYIKH